MNFLNKLLDRFKPKSTSSKIRDILEKNRTLLLEGEIDKKSVEAVKGDLLRIQSQTKPDSKESIYLIINNTGGDVLYGLELCDFMRVFITVPIIGVVFGKCYSTASMILLHCDQRISTPNASFLIHSVTADIKKPLSLDNIEKVFEEEKSLLLKIDAQVVDIYINNLTPARWKDNQVSTLEKRQFVTELFKFGDRQSDCYLSTTDAVEIGLVDRIETKKLPCLAQKQRWKLW